MAVLIFFAVHWTSFCGDAVKVVCMIRHEGLQLCFGSLNWWIESLQSLVTPGFPMAKFGKTPSLHACYWLRIFSKSSPFSGSFKIHSKWCNLQIHPSPDPSRCARRVPCQASAASTDMRSVGNSGSWGWIKSNCHMLGYENQSTPASLVRTDPYHPITSHNHIVPRKQFPSSNKDCLVSDHSINSGFWVLEGIVLVCTHRNLSVFIADALLHCQFLGGVTARTLVVERALQQ